MSRRVLQVADLPAASIVETTVNITPEQIVQLKASPITLLAGQGDGKLIRVTHVTVQYRPGTTGFTVGGGNLRISYEGDTTALTDLIAASAIALTGTTAKEAYATGESVVVDLSKAEGKGIVVSNDSGSEWTGGDGYLAVSLRYSIISNVTLRPGGTGLSISPFTVNGGTGATGSFSLSAPAPGVIVVAVESDSPYATVPATVTVPEGSQGHTDSPIAIATTNPPSNTVAHIKVTYGNVSRTANLTVHHI